MTSCVGVCKLDDTQTCIACRRTLQEIVKWRELNKEDRQRVMERVIEQVSTHSCPSCAKPAYCAMEGGKSSSTCWCMTTPRKELSDLYEDCLCESCLK